MWPKYKVADLTLFHKQGYYTKDKYDPEGNVYLLRGTDMQNPSIVISDTPKINVSEKDYENFKALTGDVLIVRSGAIGRYGIVDKDTPQSIFGSYLINFRLNNNLIRNDYFGYFYESFNAINQLIRISQGGSNININAENIKDLRMKVPPLEEQKKIANILSTWDRAIEKVNKIILDLEHSFISLKHELVSAKLRFNRFNKKIENVQISSFLKKVRYIKVLNPKDYFLLSVKLHNKGIEYTENKPNMTENGRPYYMRNSGELLIGRQNYHNGGIAMTGFQEGSSYIASNAISGFVAKKGILKYYYYLLSDIQYYKKVGHLIGGTGQKEISEVNFLKLKVKTTDDVEEQLKIVKVLDAYDRLIRKNKELLKHYKLQKKGLMQQLLTGKIRVQT
jgi:type I restriction enzyme, S subunit